MRLSGKQVSRKRVNRSHKGKTIMGDRSPKSIHKQAGQKQSKHDQAARTKQQAVAAKQAGNKK